MRVQVGVDVGQRDLDLPGAPKRRLGYRVVGRGRTANGGVGGWRRVIRGRVGPVYCKDAFEGLAKMDQLIDDETREALWRGSGRSRAAVPEA